MDKEEQKKTKKKKKKINLTASIILSILLTAVVAFVLFMLMQGSTSTTGQYPENVSDESLTCTATNIDYPFFTYDNASKKTAEINILFSKNELKSIAFVYSLYYSNATAITGSESHNHAAMNKSFAESSLRKADAYNAKYARMEDRMQMNLYATSSDFDNVAQKYFLIDSDLKTPNSIADFESIYKKSGFNCKSIKN